MNNDLNLRRRIYIIIFEADTRIGFIFDVGLIIAIVLSLIAVMLDSVASIATAYRTWLDIAEWVFTILFTVEYLLRLYCTTRPIRYAISFFGIVDLLSILPTYVALLFPGVHLLIDIRVLRLLRIFRIMKLTHYVSEYTHLARALRSSQRKISVFLLFVSMMVMVTGTLMYVIEGPIHGFSSIPTSMYWAVTTMTTVGFGDITPHTDLGRLLASVMMLMGWGILAVPTGIVTSEVIAQNRDVTTRTCSTCLTEGLLSYHKHCHYCGASLQPYQSDRAN